MEKLFPLDPPPGLRSDGTNYQNRTRWVDGNLVRFFQGTIRPVGGWVARTPSGVTPSGVPTKAIAWNPEIIGVNPRPVLAWGTTAGLYVLVDNVVHDITPSGLATDPNRVWSMDTFGSYLIATAWSKGDYTKHAGPFVWTGDTGTVAADLAAAPASVTSVLVTEERFLYCLGGVDSLGPNYGNYPTVPSTRTVHWPTQEKLTDWVPLETNSAGNFPLVTNGDLLAGLRVRGQHLLLTTTDAHIASYIGGEFVYRFQQAGTECGVIAVNAAVATDVAAFWMGTNGFFHYDGFTKPLPCDVSEAVFSTLNRNYAHRIWALHNPAFGEVTWYYPSGSSQVPNQYVTFNYREAHWTLGTLTRCAGVTVLAPGAVPVMIDESNVIYDHETGTARGGASPYLETGPFELGEGDRVFTVVGLIPDEKSLGQLNVTLKTKLYPTDAAVSWGPYTHTARTPLRVTARQVQLRFTEATESDWRLGSMRLAVTPSGLR